MTEKKSIVEWVKGVFGQTLPETETIPDLPEERVVTTLIDRAADDGKRKENSDDGDDNSEKKGCSYAVKRNIVLSLREIKKFAEEHNLAGTMIRALLMLLAEMALGALKGKVSANVLEALLKVFTYEQALSDSYRRGETDARNAAIEREYFPAGSDSLPHFRGLANRTDGRPDIFAMAEEA